MLRQNGAIAAKMVGVLVFAGIQDSVTHNLAFHALERLALAPGIYFIIVVSDQKNVIAETRGRLSQQARKIGFVHGFQIIKTRGRLLDRNQSCDVARTIGTYTHGGFCSSALMIYPRRWGRNEAMYVPNYITKKRPSQK